MPLDDMKYTGYILIFALLPLMVLFMGCSKELELEPTGGTLTSEQMKEAGKLSPDRNNVIYQGMYGELKRFNRLGNSPGYGYDFGVASFALLLDHLTDKMWSPENQYNWYMGALRYIGRNEGSAVTELVFSSYYAIIAEANKVLNTVSADSEEGQSFHAQARALRAYSYLNLIQLWQFTYKGHEDMPGVPIVREDMTRAQQIDNPRAKVREVYDYILQDLNFAKDILQDSIPKQKYKIGGCAVYGLLARTYLLMQRYSDANAAAYQALQIANRSGITPLTTTESRMPGFNDINIHNVIWGIDFTPEDLATRSVLNTWESMMCSLKYAQTAPLTYSVRANVLRKVNPDFFETINPNDSRQAWFVTNKNTVGLSRFLSSIGASASEIPDQIKLILKNQWKDQEYVNIKFAPYDNNPGARINATDFPLMRVEELYLIQAEAIAKDNETEGIRRLEAFVTTYRHPTYNYVRNQRDLGQNTFEDEIYRQRALEFWGEGITFYDMMRLERNMIRRGTLASKPADEGGYPKSTRFDVKADDPGLLFQFPRREILNNPRIEQNVQGEQRTDDF